jgi:CBS domain-containing protein
MSIKAIISVKGADVITGVPEMKLADVVALLAKHRIGAVVITDGNRSIRGILSERDVVRSIARDGAAALDEPVDRHMTRDVTTCPSSVDIGHVMEVMTRGRFRHLPIVDDGALTGIISIGDVVKHRIAEVERDADAMREYIAAG